MSPSNAEFDEEDSKESDIRLRSFIASMNDLVFVLDEDLVFQEYYQPTNDTLLMSPEQFIGKSFDEIGFPEPAHRTIRNALSNVRQTGEPSRSEYYLETQEVRSWYDLQASSLKDRHGNRTGIIAVVRDISERHRIEQAWHDSEEKLLQIFNNVNDAIQVHGWTEDRTPGLFLDVNDVACRMLGYTREEMMRLRPLDIATSYHDPPLEKVLENLRTVGSARFETGHRRKDGTIVPVEVHDRLLNRDDSKIVIGVVRDITENKQNLSALKIANKKLNLLSSITRHDINNQLMALQGYLTLLERKHPEIAKDDLLLKAENSAERISSMIEFTKTYEDIGVQSPGWHDVHKLIEKCANEVNLGKIKLENDIPSGTEVFADPLVVKVFCNLIHNATIHGGEVEHIRFAMEEEREDRTIICVDDGIGISTEVKEKLFTKGFGMGHGLGLFLSREILAITGITIKEEGETGKGARFVMTVPLDGIRQQISP